MEAKLVSVFCFVCVLFVSDVSLWRNNCPTQETFAETTTSWVASHKLLNLTRLNTYFGDHTS